MFVALGNDQKIPSVVAVVAEPLFHFKLVSLMLDCSTTCLHWTRGLTVFSRILPADYRHHLGRRSLGEIRYFFKHFIKTLYMTQ